MDATMLFVWVVVGAIAGWLASLIMGTNRSQGTFADILVGIVGGLVGGFLLGALGVGGGVTGLNIASIVIAFVGAVLMLIIMRTAMA